MIIGNNNDRNGITAEIQNYGGGFRANRVRGQVEKQIANINSAIKEGVNKMLSTDNASLWSAGNISIENGKVRVEFEKSEVGVKDESTTLPSLEQNIIASEQFIKSIRNSSRYSQDPDYPQYMKSDLGYRVAKPVDKGWFDIMSLTTTAMDRYKLPLAMYIDRNHARLVVKGAYQTPEGMKIKVYDPMSSGFQEIKVDDSGGEGVVGLYSNSSLRYDLTALLESPEIEKFSSLLTNMKAFGFQREFYNCVPYCLFVAAMLNGLEPGATEFKRQGIKQFEKDFGVRIITREEMLPKNLRVERLPS